MNFLIKLLISAVAVIVSSYLLPGVYVDGFVTAIIVAAVLSFFNAVVKPILIILTIPVTIISLGLFLLVINAVLIMLADALIDGFRVNGFWHALLFSLVLSLVNSVFNGISSNTQD